MIICGDAITELRKLPEASVNCCVTSPPYWGLRDYGVEGQLGLEKTPEEYVARMVEIFREVRRVLRKDGTLWLNLGDSYCSGNRGGYKRNRAGVSKNLGRSENCADFQGAPNRSPIRGLKDKDLIGIPWRVAFALQADGWYLRQDIIWSKPNPMPESVTDRCTKAHEYIFLLSKSRRYYYDAESIKEPGIYAGPNGSQLSPYAQGFKRRTKEQEKNRQDKQRGHSWRHAGFNDRWDAMERTDQCSVLRNKRSVWTVATRPFSGAHFATFPPDLIEPMIKAGCPVDGTVLDPFFGSGTTGLVAMKLARKFIGIELNPDYCEMARERIYGPLGMLKAGVCKVSVRPEPKEAK